MDNIYNINTDSADNFIIDSFVNPIDDLETILFLYKRQNNLKWKTIVICLHHAIYMFCIANLKGSNPGEVISRSFDNNRNIYFQKGEDRWKKSKIIRYKNSQLFQFGWDYIDGEPTVQKNIKLKNKEELIGFWTALARVQDPELYMGKFIFSKPLILSDAEKDNIIKLVDYRNQFTHFIPISSLVKIDRIKKIVRVNIDVIERLANNLHFTVFADKLLVEKMNEIILELKIIFGT